jgi:hypothetical protein
MSTGRHAKRERERAKQARAEHKRERRANRTDAGELDDAVPARAEADVLAELATLHDAHRSGEVTFDDFEVAKADLISQLQL